MALLFFGKFLNKIRKDRLTVIGGVWLLAIAQIQFPKIPDSIVGVLGAIVLQPLEDLISRLM